MHVEIKTLAHIKETNGIIRGPESNTTKFITYVKTLLFNDKDIINNQIVITHSSFLTELASNEFEMTDLYFYNLDMLRICYDEKTQKNTHVCVLRWPSYTCDCLEKEMGKKRLYLIRHCAACHNHDDINIIKKAFYEYSGNVSMCLPETTKVLTDARPYLLKMFKDPRKDLTTRFSSSVIFRSILTCSLLMNILFDYT